MTTSRLKRLTADTLFGVWAALPMQWDEKDRFDEADYAENLRRVIASGPHGVYTSGSTGEFYAIDDEEFRRMVDIQVELCGGAGMPLQIGCCADATRKVLRMIEYVAARPAVGAAQIALPYWMELNDREVLAFFKDVTSAAPRLPLVHYNIPRAKRFLQGANYRRILDVSPNLIGVKYSFAGQHFSQLQESIRLTPELSYFVGEPLLASAMQIGARGCYSSLVLTRPQLMRRYFEAAVNRRWDEAIALQGRIGDFFADLFAEVAALKEGTADPVIDKGLAIASGLFAGHQRCRAPHIGWTDENVAVISKWFQARDAGVSPASS